MSGSDSSMSQSYLPGSHAELCAKQRKNQTIDGYAATAGSDVDFDKLAWNRLFSVTGTRCSQHTAEGASRGDKR
jgi:hypothetical protein